MMIILPLRNAEHPLSWSQVKAVALMVPLVRLTPAPPPPPPGAALKLNDAVGMQVTFI